MSNLNEFWGEAREFSIPKLSSFNRSKDKRIIL